MPMRDLLVAQYRDGGLEALGRTYREARARYYEADAYDFRVGTLIDVANRLVSMSEIEGAAGVHELNVEYAAGPTAYAGLIQVRLFEALEAGGVDRMTARYDELKREQPPEGFHPQTLDPLAWSLYRSDRAEPALALFELNFEEHPESFTANESLAYAVSSSGDPERGLAIARQWAAAHPSHAAGQQLIRELLGVGH